MATVLLRFSMPTFEREIDIPDCYTEQDASDYVSENSDEWEPIVCEHAVVDIVSGDYDKEEPESEPEPEEEPDEE